MNQYIESTYPISFRETHAQKLGSSLKHCHSVTLVGMKRVGISNFLRYFLANPQVMSTYLPGNHRLFVPVDLNDLIEVDVYAFWKLTLKRLTDMVENHPDLPEVLKKQSRRAFLEALQFKDLIVTIDNLKSTLLAVQDHGYSPTLFLIRFDRLKHVLSETLFGNLQSLVDATNQQTTLVFTSYRPLHQLSQQVFPQSALSVFTRNVYLPPANLNDSQIILSTFENRYELNLPSQLKTHLLELSGGHVQYLQLALLKLKHQPHLQVAQLETFLLEDEEISLQSEELFDSLNAQEQGILTRAAEQKLTPKDQELAAYLWETGMITPQNTIFSPLLSAFISNQVRSKTTSLPELSKKEHALFTLLHDNLGKVVERDQIAETVWPDQIEFGVSDWAIDRLVGRARTKLRAQKSPYRIQTVITRGYKLEASLHKSTESA